MFVFQEKIPKKQNKNTPRFLARLAIKYLKEYKDQYPPEIYDKVKE